MSVFFRNIVCNKESFKLVDFYSLQACDWLIVVSGQRIVSNHQMSNGFVRISHIDDTVKSIVENALFIPVGEYQQARCFVADIQHWDDEDSLIHFRSLMGAIDSEQDQLINRSLQLATWYRQHQFCGQCGKPTEYDLQEHSLNCYSCEISYYPRISPCMMCLVTKGDYCLLAHHQRHKEGMYSTLAGFVEAGESVEQTVHREVMEEVGLRVGQLSYFTSQAWPFPHQLMIGYFAEYASGDIGVDDNEIVDAQWFHYSQLPDIPPPNTLSGMMIAEFIRQRQVNA